MCTPGGGVCSTGPGVRLNPPKGPQTEPNGADAAGPPAGPAKRPPARRRRGTVTPASGTGFGGDLGIVADLRDRDRRRPHHLSDAERSDHFEETVDLDRTAAHF